MSTYYATFNEIRQARGFLDELVREGVSPDDISLIARRADANADSAAEMTERVRSVGDATVFVGRSDDPRRDDLVPPSLAGADMTTLEMSNLNPVDTSNSATDVDSVDQMDDSQEEMDKMTYPRRSISQSEHERDDVSMATITGFPTSAPVIDDVIDADTPLQDQMADSFETIEVPGFGIVAGGGALATAALDFANPENPAGTDRLVDFLKDEGIPEPRAKDLCEAFDAGRAFVAVAVNPGDVNEQAVERIADRYQVADAQLYDAPRFYEGGAEMR